MYNTFLSPDEAGYMHKRPVLYQPADIEPNVKKDG